MFRRRRIREAFRALDAADSRAAWSACAAELDQLLELDAWRADDHSPIYDAAAVNAAIAELDRLRVAGDVAGVADALHTTLHRHLPDLADASLYDTAFSGTKHLVERFYGAVEATMDWLAAAPLPEPLAAERRARLRAQAQAFGRSALMLSGGATLGFYHLGVVKALFEAQLLPDILGDASMGAMIGAGIASRTDDALRALFADLSQVARDALAPAALARALHQRALLEPARLRKTLLHNVGDATFAEAFAQTGRTINISVSPTRHRQKPRVLCHLTAPDVLLASAALASSSVPGLFPAATLRRRRPGRAEEDYLPGERWIDGSMLSDIPSSRVGRLHNVNHFIVSQTNPHVVPFVSGHQKGPYGFVRGLVARSIHRQGVQVTAALRDLAGRSRWSPAVDVAHALWAQAYRGDIDIVPPVPARTYLRLVSNPTAAELDRYVLDGERGAWPALARVRDATRLSRALSRAVAAVDRAEGTSVQQLSRPHG